MQCEQELYITVDKSSILAYLHITQSQAHTDLRDSKHLGLHVCAYTMLSLYFQDQYVKCMVQETRVFGQISTSCVRGTSQNNYFMKTVSHAVCIPLPYHSGVKRLHAVG